MSIGVRSNEDRPDLHAVDDRVEDLVTISRNVALSASVGGGALLFGACFLIRAGSAFDALAGLVLLAVAVVNLLALVPSRTPVLVADQQGIRLRVGLTWRGLPWSSMRQVVVEPATSTFHEGRLVIVPRDPRALRHRPDRLGELHLRWNKYWYGASLAVPLGMSTVVDSDDLAAEFVVLAAGRVEVVGHLHDEIPGPRHAAEAPSYAAVGQPVPDEDDEGPAWAAQEQAGVTGVATVVDAVVLAEPEPVEELPEPVMPLRDLHTPARVDVRLDWVAEGAAVPPVPQAPLVPQQREVERSSDGAPSAPGWDELPVEIVIDDLADLRPSTELLIGAKVTKARECLDMSIEELSQRTRIRPHVLEAIERDDFVPCGGDFYARGHLTAISRALGLTLDPLLAIYDEHYAQAPINARRVFETELSGGLAAGTRSTLGGPRWSLLIGSVLSLTMIWGLARVFAGDPEQLTAAPDSSRSASLAGNPTPITSPKMRTTTMSVRAVYASTHVVIKDRTGKILWSGDLRVGKHRTIIGLAPFHVAADNAGAVVVTVRDKLRGDLGTAGAPGAKDFG